MGIESFYKKEAGYFVVYTKHTTEKKILIKKIINKIKGLSSFKNGNKFVFTDIGAGNGAVTIPVINFLKNKVDLTCNYIEQSKGLIKVFKKNCDFKNIKVFNEKVQDVNLPKSDFILASHVFVYLGDYDNILKRIHNALKDNGLALIVETNPASGDVRFRKKLRGLNETHIAKEVIKILNKEGIDHKHEVVESSIDFSDCYPLNDTGKAMVGMFTHKSFDEISKEEVKRFLKVLKGLLDRNNKLKVKEDYVWMFKK